MEETCFLLTFILAWRTSWPGGGRFSEAGDPWICVNSQVSSSGRLISEQQMLEGEETQQERRDLVMWRRRRKGRGGLGWVVVGVGVGLGVGVWCFCWWCWKFSLFSFFVGRECSAHLWKQCGKLQHCSLFFDDVSYVKQVLWAFTRSYPGV